VSAETRTTSSTGGQKGVKLQRFDLLPIGPLTALAEHYGVGASKYADHNYRNGYEWSKSYAALMRHLTAFWAGYDYDVCSNDLEGCQHVDAEGRPFVAIREDACFNHTGSHHMTAVAWHAFALMEFTERYPEHDDRYTTVLARESAEAEEARLLAEQAKFAPFAPLGPEWTDLGYVDAEHPETPFHYPVPFRIPTPFLDRETITLTLQDTPLETLRLAFGLPIHSPARFVVGIEGTEDLKTRD
jgi:hypothetical protein